MVEDVVVVLVVDLGEVEVWVVICVVVSMVKEVEVAVVELAVVVVEYKVLDEGLVVVEGQLGVVVGDVAKVISQCPGTS